jgi:hypothetical protein
VTRRRASGQYTSKGLDLLSSRYLGRGRGWTEQSLQFRAAVIEFLSQRRKIFSPIDHYIGNRNFFSTKSGFSSLFLYI